MMNFKDEQEKVLAALALLDSEEADAIIGETNPEHKALLQGMEGAHAMMFIMAGSNGMKNTPEVREMAAKGKLAMLTLVHYAYALGMKNGQQATANGQQATVNGKRKTDLPRRWMR